MNMSMKDLNDEQRSKIKDLEKRLRGPCEEIEEVLEEAGAMATIIVQPVNVMSDGEHDRFLHFTRDINHEIVTMPDSLVQEFIKGAESNEGLADIAERHNAFVPSHLMLLIKMITGDSNIPVAPLLEKAHELKMKRMKETLGSLTKLIEKMSEQQSAGREGWEPLERDGEFVGFWNPETGEEDLMN